MGENTSLLMTQGGNGNGLAILDVNALERDVDGIWGLSQSVENEIGNPLTKLYRGALRVFSRGEVGDDRVYTLLARMQDKMGRLSGEFDRLQLVYRERAESDIDFLVKQQEEQESGNNLMKRLDAGIDEREQHITKAKDELGKMKEDQEGFYRLRGETLVKLIEKTDMEGLETSLEKTMDLRNDVTKRIAADLISAGRVHQVLTGFSNQMNLIVAYFERSIGIKMYEIQAGNLTEQSKIQLRDFGKIYGKFCAEAKKGIQQLRSVENGDLFSISAGRRVVKGESSSFEYVAMHYVGAGANGKG